MKWIEILRKDNYALLQSENDTQYAVVSGYDTTQPEDQQWAYGTYFTYWNDANRKENCLQDALNYFRKMDENAKDVIYPEEITGTFGRLLDEVDMPMDIQKEVEELYKEACKLL